MFLIPRAQQIKALNRLGESEVRYQIASFKQSGEYETNVAQEWLRQLERSRAEASAASRDAREIETLALAKEANTIASSAREEARRANRIATIAIVFSTIVAVASIAATIIF